MINRSAIFQPTKWGNAYFKHLIEEEWVLLEEGPGGHNQVGNTIDSKSTSSANKYQTSQPSVGSAQWKGTNGTEGSRRRGRRNRNAYEVFILLCEYNVIIGI